jgi:MFS family permease
MDVGPDDLQSARTRNACIQLNTAIAHIGPGPYQLVVLILGGGVYAAEGSLLLMLSVIAKSLIIRWKLSAMFAGAMVTIVFIGLLFGTIAGGFLCDRYGRRMPILVTYTGITLFLAASLMSSDILLLVTAKFMLGVSLGFGVPAANAIVCESCPPSHRSNVYSMTMIMFSLGQMYSACVLWILSPEIDHSELHWRLMLALAALMPFLLSIFAYFFLLESPHWLLAEGRFSEAKEVILTMSSYKGTVSSQLMESLTDDIYTPAGSPGNTPAISSKSPDPSFSEEEPRRSCCSQEHRFMILGQLQDCMDGMKEDFDRLRQLFNEKFRTTTIMMSYISFVSNFAYYGMIYGLPDTLKKEQGDSSSAWSPAAGVFFSAVFEIPGVFIAILLGTTVGRKMNMTISFGCTAFSLAAVTWVLNNGRLENAGLAAVFLVKIFIASVFIVVYLYLLECYPTKFRATGLAFCMVIGRLGAFACPFLYDGLAIAGIHYKWFFVVMGCFVLVAAFVSYMLPYETKDCGLMEDDAPETLSEDIEALLSARYMNGRKSQRVYNTMGGATDAKQITRSATFGNEAPLESSQSAGSLSARPSSSGEVKQNPEKSD